MNSNYPVQLPVSDFNIIILFPKHKLSLKEAEVADGIIQTWNFLLCKILMLSCHERAYFLRYVFHCLAQISSCPILGVTVDFPLCARGWWGCIEPLV